MTESKSDCRQAFQDAIRKAAQDYPELTTKFLGADHSVEDVYEMLADCTADGDGSLLVFLTGREFTGKVLESLPSAAEYEVCALIREAIEFCISTKDSAGTLRCGNFYTLHHVESLLQAGIQIELESEPA